MIYVLCPLLAVLLLILVTTLICFFRVFFSPKRKPLLPNTYDIPSGKAYMPHREAMIAWMKNGRNLPHEQVSIQSFDGLTLRGRYYEYKPGAPLELLFHGYRGNADRDLSGGVERCFALGRNALIINQRACGESDGSVISFGINERKDCLRWVHYAIHRFGGDVKIILTGISMGAATVMMAAGEELPSNVVCILADCGYSSAKEIIQKIISEMHLPPKLIYPFVALAARLFGHFRLDETSPMEAMKRCHVPVIFIHGEGDTFVPCSMSKRLYETCTAKKKFVTVPDAGHVLSYPVNKELYLQSLRDFEKECGF